MTAEPLLHSDVAAARDSRGQRSGERWLFAAAALLIAFSIFVRGLNHDEGQYVGAIALMRGGWPYIDFAYLQTPLQPLLLAPLSLIPAGWLLLAARIANGLFGLATIALLAIELRNRVQSASVLIALGALACTEPFLWGASLGRNDALPMLLLTGAVVSLLRSLREEKPALQLAFGGLLLGLATSAKISAAVPAAGAVLYILLRARQLGPKPLMAFAVGAFAGLLPCFVFAAIAPDRFRFDVFTYSLQAPAQWWASVGRADMLQPPHRLIRLLRFSAEGVILVGLAAAVLDRRRSEDRLLLDLMILGGAIGSYMPEPAYAQYLIPLLPPLVPRFALALDGIRGRSRRALLFLTIVSCGFGLYYTARLGFRAWRHGSELIASIGQGHEAARLARGRSIVTLSPEVVAGSDASLDRRFVTGPFLYRTFGALGADALAYGFSPSWERIDAALDAQPPGAILVGREHQPHPLHPQGLDGRLVKWSMTHGYRPVRLHSGFTLFIRG
jgi:4-amino-4-deoxy-L-arabinose transferase-like glycosyltransferase